MTANIKPTKIHRVRRGQHLSLNWLSTRRPVVFTLFLVCVLVATIFLLLGYWTNPYLPKPFREQPSATTISGQEEFELPNVLTDTVSSNVIHVLCNVTSNNFVIDEPAYLYVEVSVGSAIYNIVDVQVTPKNAIEYAPFENTSSNGMPVVTHLYLCEHSGDRNYDRWTGYDYIQFQASGALEITLSFYMSLKQGLDDPINPIEYEREFSKDITFESIVIKSNESTQQKITENMNLSLTYIVLFFATLEIAITLYDHSEDKDKKNYYEKKKAKQKQYDNADPSQDVGY